jgi:hypothetical protein
MGIGELEFNMLGETLSIFTQHLMQASEILTQLFT